MVKKVKPLHQLRYKESMSAIEATSPGTKAQVLLGFLERGSALFEVLPVELLEGTAP
jgi:hypothetical protein